MTLGLWALYDERGWYSATAALTTDLLHVLETTPSTPERSQEEILLQTSLARVLLATKGYTQEVEAAYARAIELCEAYGHQAELLPALRGLANLYAFVTDFEKGARVGEQILALAEERDDPAMRVEGHFVVASCVFGVDPKGGLDHLDRALAEYDPDRYPPRRYHLGNDPGVPCLTTSALLLWMLGYPDRARERADRAIALAQRLDHPYSAAYAAFHMGLLHLWLGEPSGAERLAAEGLRIATAQGFEIWRALALCLQGAALAEQGRAAEGLTLVERGVGQYGRLRTPPVFWPLLQFVRARVSMQAGRLEHAMSLLDDALAIVEPSPVDPQAGEMFRMKGELLLATSPDRAEEAERWFQRALQLARERDVRTMELRAATSLARLWRTQGRQEDSRRLVEEALDRLPEGRNTADAREASALLG
jgi:tetratricopeptide (TPR) repeat protein